MRIGLISDTHIPIAGRDLWPQVYEALRGNGDYGGWQRTVPPARPGFFSPLSCLTCPDTSHPIDRYAPSVYARVGGRHELDTGTC